ncbi:glycosyltransferase family 4 protein [Roseibium sp. CAU 1637]|uniref:Glycosyltransferase family 4 protein n=1 Tax=Roseibium limicola TaxID=2816037 RepID=A0A939EQS4_9HYPH|nr:glycosyltransferase family 4 protein [Roseibium limicola]MBO0346382.1 glycosyltransferase family 4 protein [Roseibium limicola]
MKVAIVLPRGMHFGPNGATSIDIVAHDLWQTSRFRDQTYVLGENLDAPFEGVDFRAVEGRSQRQLTSGFVKALKADRPDVIIVHQHPETAARIAKAMAPMPVILHRHGLLKQQRSAFSRWLKELQFQRFRRIIFVSDFIRDQFLLQFPQFEASSQVIYNGVDTRHWCPLEKSLHLIYVGRAREDKGLLPLINAFADLSKHPDAMGWRLKLVLGVQTEAEQVFARHLTGVTKRINGIDILQNLTSEQVRFELGTASIAALPSIVKEGFPRAVVEAMACGCATIATAQGGTQQAAGNGALLLENPDADDFKDRLRQAILQLMSDDEARASLAAAGRKRALDALQIAVVSGETDDLLVKLAGGQ